MLKTKLTVPEGIKYMSDWDEYVMPRGHCIVDKGVTGCGYTEMCLVNSNNVILCSPRKMLLENKRDQHVLDENILYLENDLPLEPTEEDFNEFRERMGDHIKKCDSLGKPVKFMITYDSAKYLIKYLQRLGELRRFMVVADEFQSIFLDAYYKAEIENSFVNLLQGCPDVIYLSATPLMDKYLVQLDEFKNLPFYELDWSKSGHVETIKLQHKKVGSLGSEAIKIIRQYLAGDFPKIISESKEIIQSTEAVLYFNSITEIMRIINKSGLTPDQCNILCANDETNRRKIRKTLGKNFIIGKIPLKDEPNKMFTFCTKTVYVGADFYSKCASTYVFADPNLTHLALDISLDLPQIAGRQRDRENPFKNYITVFYKITKGENVEDRGAFDKVQEERKVTTNLILSSYDKLTEQERKINVKKLISDIKISKYSGDFISITANYTPTYNKLIEISNERAWEVVQKDYQDVISVTKAISSVSGANSYEYVSEEDKVVREFLARFYATGVFTKKMKAYCEFMDRYKDNANIVDSLCCKISDTRFRSYYNLLGTVGCKAIRYQEDLILKKLSNQLKDDDLTVMVLKEFSPGDRLLKKDIKERLRKIYQICGIKSIPKATDLERWFELKELRVTNPVTNKRDSGFELLALK